MFSGLPYAKNQTYYSNKTQLKKLKIKPKTQKPKTSLSSHPHTYYHQKNINDQLMQQQKRKQNYLNSKYNQRLGELKKITTDNKKIYNRINSQKSLYSQKDQRKSYQSLRSLSRCSSRSKQSKDEKQNTQRNSFRSSFRMTNKNKTNYNTNTNKANNVTIQSESINKVKDSNLKDFQKIFLQNQQNNKKILNARQSKRQNRSVSLKVENKGGMGGMLHKIAEEMYGVGRTNPMRKMLY